MEDKVEKSGLTLAWSDDTPYFGESTNVILCKKLFVQQLHGDGILDPKLKKTWYPNEDYHFLYIAEVTKVMRATR